MIGKKKKVNSRKRKKRKRLPYSMILILISINEKKNSKGKSSDCEMKFLLLQSVAGRGFIHKILNERMTAERNIFDLAIFNSIKLHVDVIGNFHFTLHE